MILKFNKAQLLKHNTQNKDNFLNIAVQSDTTVSILKPRKIKHKTINFYNQSIHIPFPNKPIRIYMQETSNSPLRYFEQQSLQTVHMLQTQHQQQLINIILEYTVQKQKKCKNMIFENQQIKVFWDWKMEEMDSRKNSLCTRDLKNIDTPKRENSFQWKQWRNSTRDYSPAIKKRNNVALFTDEVMSDKNQASLNKRSRVILKNQEEKEEETDPINKKNTVKSKSVDTRSKTISRKDLLMKRSLPLAEHEKLVALKDKKKMSKSVEKVQQEPLKANMQLGSHLKMAESLHFDEKIPREFKKINNLSPQKFHKRNRNKNSSLNKLGFLVASTVGILTGLIASVYAPY